MGRKRAAKSPTVDVELSDVLRDMRGETLNFYLHLCWTPLEILKQGFEKIFDYWETPFSKNPKKEIETLKSKRYVRFFIQDGEYIRIKILKRLMIPVNNNLAFFYQSRTKTGKPLPRVTTEPFDDQRKELKKRVVEYSKSLNKKTSAGGIKTPKAEVLIQRKD